MNAGNDAAPAPAGAACFWAMSPERRLGLGRPRLVGILNATPDSFSDGGLALDPAAAASRAAALIEAGADALDVGGESTRPGAARVPAEEQIRRIAPAVRAIRGAGIAAPISVDTTLAAVAEAAFEAGADAVNDVSGGSEDPDLLRVCAERGRGVVLMHRLTTPDRDRYSHSYPAAPEYAGGVVSAVRGALSRMLEAAVSAGIPPEAVLLDPGLGFGKTVEQNLELVRACGRIQGAIGRPLLGAASRKSFVGVASGLGRDSEPRRRVAGSVAVALEMWRRGVRIFRVHDVREHAEALRAAAAVQGPEAGPQPPREEPAGPAGSLPRVRR